MKLIIAILRDIDQDPVSSGLTQAGYRVTHIASTGGFLRKGSSTLLIGLDPEQVEPALAIIRAKCAPPAEPGQRRATIFVVPVENAVSL